MPSIDPIALRILLYKAAKGSSSQQAQALVTLVKRWLGQKGGVPRYPKNELRIGDLGFRLRS